MAKSKESKEAKETINNRMALIEMYKAGFLDGFRNGNKVRSKKDYLVLNKAYKKAFMKRFEKRINKSLNKLKKLKK